MNAPMNANCSPKQEALEVVIAELERSLVVLESNYRKAVSNLAMLRQCVDTDDLTRLLRRGAFMKKLADLLSQSREEGREVHLMMIDVDHFKKVNDTYGHQTGDLVLQQIAELIGRYMRPQDLAGRYGGEEIIVAVQASAQEAHLIAERIRLAVESHCIAARAPRNGQGAASANADDRVEFHVTLSMGAASTQEYGYEAESLIGEADAALYRAKHAGRNQVMVAQKSTGPVVLKVEGARAA